MAAIYFVIGFATALGAAAATLLGVFFYFRSHKKPPIKGYLDLIPDLTPEQKEKVQEIRKTFLPKLNRIREDLCQKRAELAESLFREPTDHSALSAIGERILRYQAELEREVIEHIIEEQELLTPAQRKRFYEIIVEQFSSGGLGVHDIKRRL